MWWLRSEHLRESLITDDHTASLSFSVPSCATTDVEGNPGIDMIEDVICDV